MQTGVSAPLGGNFLEEVFYIGMGAGTETKLLFFV